MGDNSITLTDTGPGQEGLTARKRALFFYVPVLAVSLIGSFFIVACETTASRPEEEIISEVSAVSPEFQIEYIEPEPTSNPEIIQPEPEIVEKQDCDPVAKEMLEELQTENEVLKEENGRLHLEMIGLNKDLAEANAEIYSLHMKLDAIFKPKPGGN